MGPPPTIPSGLMVESTTTDSVSVSWRKSRERGSGNSAALVYEVQWRVLHSSASDAGWEWVSSPQLLRQSYFSKEGLLSACGYQLRVRAVIQTVCIQQLTAHGLR